MKRSLTRCIALAALTACAPALPPAPSVEPASLALDDSLALVLDLSAESDTIPVADAVVLNDLAATAPDRRVVPEFDAEAVRWDIDVHTYATHPRVVYYLNYFQGPARARMAVFLERSARFEPLIRRRFEAEGLPGDLGYLALIESGYSSDAVSRSYAVGMWQFMRGTGRGYGLRVDSWVDERRDPVRATDAAARHLSDLRRRFGSLYLAAAAYNAGAGKVSRSLGRLQWDEPTVEESDSAVDLEAEDELGTEADAAEVTSDAAFFRLASTDLLAAETQDYVPKLIAAALIAKAPARYGFESATGAALAYDSLVVDDAAGLDVLARLGGMTLAEIRSLNPQYLRLATPPRTRSLVRLPAGTGEAVAAAYRALPSNQRVRYLSHVVRRGERLRSIARRYHLPAADLRAANPRAVGRPAPGTRLVIPAVAVPSAMAMRATGTLGSPHATRAGGRVHRVRRGETLSGIALRYRVSVRSLRRVNAIRIDHALRAGARLRIPG